MHQHNALFVKHYSLPLPITVFSMVAVTWTEVVIVTIGKLLLEEDQATASKVVRVFVQPAGAQNNPVSILLYCTQVSYLLNDASISK